MESYFWFHEALLIVNVIAFVPFLNFLKKEYIKKYIY